MQIVLQGTKQNALLGNGCASAQQNVFLYKKYAIQRLTVKVVQMRDIDVVKISFPLYHS